MGIDAAGIVTHKKNPCCAKSSQCQSGCTIRNRDDHAPLHPSITVPSCHRGVHPLFVSRTVKRALRRPGRCRGRDSTTSWWPSPASRRHHARPHASETRKTRHPGLGHLQGGVSPPRPDCDPDQNPTGLRHQGDNPIRSPRSSTTVSQLRQGRADIHSLI